MTSPESGDSTSVSPPRPGLAKSRNQPSGPTAVRKFSRRTAIALAGGAGVLGLGCLASSKLLKVPPLATLALPDSAAPSAIPIQDRATVAVAQGVDIDFVRVPAGQFIMGSVDGYQNERPQLRLFLPEYWIGRTHVTVAQFSAFVMATGYKTQAENDGFSYALIALNWRKVVGANWAHPKGPDADTKGRDDHPVVHISWDDAVAFCSWVSASAGLFIRLPTEAEWEKAARGVDGRKYPWGDRAPTNDLLNFQYAVGATTFVGKYSPDGDSPYGCVDMMGNARQWVSSLFKDYPYSATDRESVTDRGDRVLRGGGFDNYANHVSAAFRDLRRPPNYYAETSGFRVCASSV